MQTKVPKFKPGKTVLTIVTGLLLVHILTLWTWPIKIAFAIGATSVLSSWVARQITWVWERLTWALSLVVPNVVLSIIFFFLLFPTSQLAKFFGKKDPLRLRNTSSSFFKNTNKEFDANSFENPW